MQAMVRHKLIIIRIISNPLFAHIWTSKFYPIYVKAVFVAIGGKPLDHVASGHDESKVHREMLAVLVKHSATIGNKDHRQDRGLNAFHPSRFVGHPRSLRVGAIQKEAPSKSLFLFTTPGESKTKKSD
jgi:hypothetical protein